MSGRGDRWLAAGLRAAGLLAGSIVLLILLFLARESAAALSRVAPARFVTDPGWHPTRDPGEFRLLAMVVATLATTAGAVALAAPLGLLAAYFGRFLAPPAVARPFRALMGVAAGIPSVVFGFWGLVTLVPRIRELAPPGPSLLAGVLVLAMMIVPTIALLADSTLASLPSELLRGAAALSLSRWNTLRGVVLPAALPGLSLAVLLGTLRAMGETMAVLMVCGNVVRVPRGPFDSVRTLTANIALELGYATREHRSVLFVSGLALMLLVLALVLAGRRAAGGWRHA